MLTRRVRGRKRDLGCEQRASTSGSTVRWIMIYVAMSILYGVVYRVYTNAGIHKKHTIYAVAFTVPTSQSMSMWHQELNEARDCPVCEG